MPLFPPKSRDSRVVVFILLIVIMVSALVGFRGSPTERAYAAETGSSYVSASGRNLYLNGERYQFTGVNAYNLGTFPGANAGCGSYVADVDSFFSQLRPNSVVRMWAFQGSMTTNVKTKKIDWTGIDRVVNAAQKNGKKLILVLGEQAGHCDDGHYKDISWYQGGYKQSFNVYANGLTPLPYLDYVKLIVERYKNSPAVAMWEPVNEPEASTCTNATGYDCYANLSCPNEQAAATAIKTFFDTVGSTIKSIDSNHLISSGTIGDGQCGTSYESYKLVHSSPGIDVASYHDYYHDDQPLPGDQWNGLQKRIDQTTLLNKPLIIGEVGMKASQDGAGCMNYTTRRDKMKAKMDAQLGAGIAGFIPWSLTLGASNGCNFDVIANDPLLNLLKTYPVAMSSVVPSSAVSPFPSPTPTPADIQPPTAPKTLISSNLTPSQVTLNWSGATDNVAISRYEIYRDYAYVTATTGTTFTHTGLTPGKTYKYYIKTRDTAGNSSGTSTMIDVTIPTVGASPTPTPTKAPTPTQAPDTQPPSAPTNLTATATSTSITLKWNAATDNVGVNRYEVYRDYSYVTAAWTTSYTNSGLTPGKTYSYYLKSRDAAGNSSGSSMKVTIKTLPQ